MADKEYYGFVWDENKNNLNKQKHKVSFETAVRIFNDPCLYVEFDEKNSTLDEARYDYTGIIDVGGMPVLYVVATEAGEKTRIISARKATAKEVSKYEQNAKNL